MSMRTKGFGLGGALAVVLGGCTGLGEICPPGSNSMHVAEILFGRNVGDRVGVSEAEFRSYVDEELTARFPEGLTILDAQGQYRGSSGIVKEPSKVALIATSDTPDARSRIRAAAEAYKRRFAQESVGVIMRRSCVSF